jgi:hypothetical protein
MYHSKKFLTAEVLSEVLSGFDWPAPYTLESKLPDGILVKFPRCTLFFTEGFEGEMALHFLLPDDLGMGRSLTLDHALLAISPDPDGSGGVPTPGLLPDYEPEASLEKVQIGIHNLSKMVLTHLSSCLLGDFGWVDRYRAYLARKR